MVIDNIYTIFFSHMGNGYSSAGESHNFHEFVYVDQGEILLETGDSENRHVIRLEQGSGYLHAPNVYHRHFVEKNMRGSLCIISFGCDSPILSRLDESVVFLTRRQKEYLATTMNCASHLFKGVVEYKTKLIFFRSENCDRLMEQILQNNLELLFLNILCDYKAREDDGGRLKNGMPELIVEEVQNYLKQNIYIKISISEICKRFAYSKTSLCNKFKAATGMSIIQYFNQLKIEAAMDLIENDNDTITHIAARLNFSSCQYFSKVFKQVVGIYPREFKSSITQKKNSKYLRKFTIYNN